MSKYSIDDVTITIHNEFFRVLEILPFNKYRGLVRDNAKPLNLFITVKDEDEIKNVLGKARYPLLKVFDVKIEGVDKDDRL